MIFEEATAKIAGESADNIHKSTSVCLSAILFPLLHFHYRHNNMGFVYLLQPAELVGTDRYLIGCSFSNAPTSMVAERLRCEFEDAGGGSSCIGTRFMGCRAEHDRDHLLWRVSAASERSPGLASEQPVQLSWRAS
eukprot:scaffold3604_cov275-Pinguiococcus_pyrenoidosus.AAC.1